MAEKPSSKGKQEETTETESPSPAPQPEQQEKAPEKPPAYVPPATREKRQRSVVHYIAILFAAAFLLMLMAYLMDQRQNQAMNDLNQSLTGLQDSITDQSSLQDIYEDNMQLIQQVGQLEDNMQLIQQVGQLEEQVKQLEEDKQSLTSQLSDQEKASQAMDWFWQIDEAYVLGRYSLCRELIQEIQDAGLVDYLPKESITDNGRFSPSGRYQEIYEALY